MNVLSLCSGIGGLDIGVRSAAPAARTICYVEIDPFCQAILLARMADGLLDRAPIFGDLRAFDAWGFRGVVGCVIGGPPCQPFSVAGKRRGADDARNLIPDALRIIRECAPSRVFLENVPGSLPYFYHVVLPALQGMGYAVAAGLVTAAEVGAPHRRQRLFVMGYAAQFSKRESWDMRLWPERGQGVGGDVVSVGYANKPRLEGRGESESERVNGWPTWPPGPSERDRWADVLARWPELAPALSIAEQDALKIAQPFASRRQVVGATPQPALRGVADELTAGLGRSRPTRVHQLRALGNAVVPAQATFAWRFLTAQTGSMIR